MLSGTTGPLTAAPCACRFAANPLPSIAASSIFTQPSHIARDTAILHYGNRSSRRFALAPSFSPVIFSIRHLAPFRRSFQSSSPQFLIAAAGAQPVTLSGQAPAEALKVPRHTAMIGSPRTDDGIGNDTMSEEDCGGTFGAPVGADTTAIKTAAQEAYAASGATLRTKRPPGMVKRSIAMHVGYVGTAFKGKTRRAGDVTSGKCDGKGTRD